MSCCRRRDASAHCCPLFRCHVRGHSTDLSGHSFQVQVRQEQRWTEVDHPSRLLAADALLSLSKPRASLPTPRATTHLLRGTVRLLDFLACRQRRVMTEPTYREPHHYLPSYSYSPWTVRPSERPVGVVHGGDSPARAHALQVYEVPLLRAQSCWPCTADKRDARARP